MTPALFLRNAVLPALGLLPAKMDSPAARAMMLAIAMQESRIQHRAQIGGPARGYWQFEQGGGVKGVLTHSASAPIIRNVLVTLDYAAESDSAACYAAIQHNDMLAACFARLLLWTLPGKLPGRAESSRGWDQYLEAWRPGKPHAATWNAFYADAWKIVTA